MVDAIDAFEILAIAPPRNSIVGRRTHVNPVSTAEERFATNAGRVEHRLARGFRLANRYGPVSSREVGAGLRHEFASPITNPLRIRGCLPI
jgi:hypothetical protein